jgi:septal ring factor EnvC (AmiA/AmiB activator)
MCPLCESHLAVLVSFVLDIRQSLAGLEQQLASVRRDSPRLQGRLASLEARRTEVEERLRAVQRDLSTRIFHNIRYPKSINTITSVVEVTTDATCGWREVGF